MLLYNALVLLASIENVILVAKAGVVMQHPRAAGVFAIMLFSVHEARWYTTMCMLYFLQERIHIACQCTRDRFRGKAIVNKPDGLFPSRFRWRLGEFSDDDRIHGMYFFFYLVTDVCIPLHTPPVVTSLRSSGNIMGIM